MSIGFSKVCVGGPSNSERADREIVGADRSNCAVLTSILARMGARICAAASARLQAATDRGSQSTTYFEYWRETCAILILICWLHNRAYLNRKMRYKILLL